MSVNGVKEITRALKARKRAHAKGLRRGLFKAALFLLRESKILVPVDKSNLVNSGDVRVEGVGFDTAVIVFYTAEYAIYVHEDLEARHKPGTQAKFLEQPLREKRMRLAAIVVEEVEKENI